MIKNCITCANCEYHYHRKFCMDGDCSKCLMNYHLENQDELPVCKCNLIEDDAECPYYKEATE